MAATLAVVARRPFSRGGSLFSLLAHPEGNPHAEPSEAQQEQPQPNSKPAENG